MKSIHYVIFFIVVLCTACKPSKYPDLKEGLYADIQTDIGDVLVDLYFTKTPMTVANFVALSEGNHPEIPDSLQNRAFYHNLKFDRVTKEFVATAAPNHTLDYSFANEFKSDLNHNSPGILSMSNKGKRYTNSTQFFITRKPTPWLNAYSKLGKEKTCGKYSVSCNTVFGKVTKGLHIIDSIKKNNVITSIDIIRVGDQADDFDARKIFLELAKKTIPFDIKMGIDSTIQTHSGLRILKIKETSGRKVKTALQTTVHYTLYNTSGKLLASSLTKQKPISFIINKDALIAGWKEGAVLLREGEKARLFIPSYLGYGSIGSPKKGEKQLVKPNEDLIFEIEILKVGK